MGYRSHLSFAEPSQLFNIPGPWCIPPNSKTNKELQTTVFLIIIYCTFYFLIGPLFLIFRVCQGDPLNNHEASAKTTWVCTNMTATKTLWESDTWTVWNPLKLTNQFRLPDDPHKFSWGRDFMLGDVGLRILAAPRKRKLTRKAPRRSLAMTTGNQNEWITFAPWWDWRHVLPSLVEAG